MDAKTGVPQVDTAARVVKEPLAAAHERPLRPRRALAGTGKVKHTRSRSASPVSARGEGREASGMGVRQEKLRTVADEQLKRAEARPMSVTTTNSRSSQRERPGMRTPIAGYSGFVPGMVSLNLHGSSWRDLVLQDPLLHPQTSRPSSARGPFSRQDPEARRLSMQPASARQSERVSQFQQSGRLSAEMIGMHRAASDEFARVPSFESAPSFGSRASTSSPRDIEGQGRALSPRSGNKFMPRMDNHWKPPIVGYGGHVPGYTSGNMHGSAWKVRVKPRVAGTSCDKM
jgi:hypothetical protein